VGTTDTPVAQPSLEPRALAEEVEFVLKHAARYIQHDPTPADVLSVFAGLRPLVREDNAASTAAISREHYLSISRAGLVTITGGKWTTYRKMGEDTIEQAATVAGLKPRKSKTAALKLHGWSEQSSDSLNVYGADAESIRALAHENPKLAAPLSSALPYVGSEVVWAARHEMARTVEDVLARRTRALFLDARASIAAAPVVTEVLRHELGRDSAWAAEQIRSYSALAKGYLLT
jgi:glycerol-3-phosphate dehydrogenase